MESRKSNRASHQHVVVYSTSFMNFKTRYFVYITQTSCHSYPGAGLIGQEMETLPRVTKPSLHTVSQNFMHLGHNWWKPVEWGHSLSFVQKTPGRFLCQEMLGGCNPCLLRETCNGLPISHRLWMPHHLWLHLEEKFPALFFTALATSFPYYDSVLFAKGRLVICSLIILSCLEMINFFFLSLISPSITFLVNCYLSSSKAEMKNVLNDLNISVPKIKLE